jgi:hypothetical protein
LLALEIIGLMVLVARRKLWVRAVAAERAAQVHRNLAAHRQIVGVGPRTGWGKASGQKGMVGKGWLTIMICGSHGRAQEWGGAGSRYS